MAVGTGLALLISGLASAGASAASAVASKKSANAANTASLGTIKEATEKFNGPKQMIPQIERRYVAPPPGYRPGVDPEHQFYQDVVTGYKPLTGMAEGGSVEPGQKAVTDVLLALKGQHPNPQAAIAAFVEEYGPEAFYELRAEVLGQGGMSRSHEGPISGPGGGMDDTVPARGPGRDILLSDGEFVIPADVVSSLGDGSTDAGAEKLYGMMSRVRQQKTGKPAQPKKIGGSVLPV